MNLLARILSHGFAFVVVALILLVLVYRGDIFEDWDLPDFLVLKGKPDATEQPPAVVDREPLDQASLTSGSPGGTAMPADDSAAADTQAAAEAAAPATATTETETTSATAVMEPARPEDTVPDAVATAPDAVAETETETETETEVAPADDSAYAGMAPAEDQVTEPEPDESNVAVPATAAAADAPGVTAESPAGEAVNGAGSPAVATADESPVAAAGTGTDQLGESAAVAMPVAADSTAESATEPASPVEETPPVAADQSQAAAAASDTTGDVATTPYTVLASAREAYWLRDFDTAEQQYQALIQLEPQNPDGYGELGNMYFSQGKWPEAAAAYYEAGVRLLDEGLIVQARQMVEVIRGLNGSQADELDAKIAAAPEATP